VTVNICHASRVKPFEIFKKLVFGFGIRKRRIFIGVTLLEKRSFSFAFAVESPRTFRKEKLV
jgi:hypothetical protein